MLDPTGPLPPAVYWRRRAVALGVATVVVVAAAWSAFAFATSGPEPPPGQRGAQPPPRAVAASAGQPAEPPMCADDAVRVTAEAVKPEYRFGEKVGLRSVVTNVGDRPCRRDLNRALREWVVLTPDGEPQWSSNDCYSESTNEMPVLQPGQSVRNDIVWNGFTSRPGCSAQQEVAPTGNYQVVAKVGGLTSAPTPFRLAR